MAISNYEYHLTPVGRVLTKKIKDIILFRSVTKKHSNFWDEHFTEAIPEEFFIHIGDLCKSEIIIDTNLDIFNVYFNFLKTIQEAKEIYILSPISSPAHTEAVLQRIKEGVYVETLVGRDLIEQLTKSSHYEIIHELATDTMSKIFVLEEMPLVGLTVTDLHISLGLYKNDGVTYDTTTDLFSTDQQAVSWGLKLYQYYRTNAVELNL
jgi:predicted transcriptional regulator